MCLTGQEWRNDAQLLHQALTGRPSLMMTALNSSSSIAGGTAGVLHQAVVASISPVDNTYTVQVNAQMGGWGRCGGGGRACLLQCLMQ
jgi:hypothetical protein